MKNLNKNNFLFEEISSLKGIGQKLKKYLKNKRIEKIKDLLWDIPYDITDRSKVFKLENLEIGKITTVKVFVDKYNFPRIRNLPNKVLCSEGNKKIYIIFFNSKEGYIKSILPLGKQVIISGKIAYYKNNYQIVNPTYVKPVEKIDEITKVFPRYSLTEGVNEKVYRKLISNVLNRVKNVDDWLSDSFLKENRFHKFKKTLENLHNPKKNIDILSNDYKRIVYDELLANFIMLSKARQIVKTVKNNKKIQKDFLSKIILKNFAHDLTGGQNEVLKELKNDIFSEKRMFRILQGDVGSGKTILAMICAGFVIESNFQVAFMSPTEILSSQHYNLAKKLFKNTGVNLSLISGKTTYKDKEKILADLVEGKTNFIFGTHALFQKKINFSNLGFIIIDEQHKFGVKQRIELAKKGGKNCDLLLMSATPIPRTMMLSNFGDMDISRLHEKPKYRKEITTLIKPENKIFEIIPLIKKQISNNQQVFWVCPLIKDSDKLNFSSVSTKYDYINRVFPNQVGLIHGALEKENKDIVLKDFFNKKIKILVSTTVIEVGIDFPDANTIIIEDANKFGLSQLHQLRGRVGRGINKSICILLYKKNLSENAKKRLKYLDLLMMVS